jgi:hypothetical protein
LIGSLQQLKISSDSTKDGEASDAVSLRTRLPAGRQKTSNTSPNPFKNNNPLRPIRLHVFHPR